MGSLKQKFEAFGFKTITVDGHDVEKLYKAFDFQSSKPKVILANTIKGKGVSFMENNLLWHYKNPSMEQFLEAKQELKCAHNLSTIF
jgi:transketolase